MIKKQSKLKAAIGDALTESQVKEIALAIFKNDIFTDRHCPDAQAVMQSFPVLHFVKKDQLKRFKNAGMIYEYMNRASPMGINGRPMFLTCHVLSKLDADRVWKMHDRIKASTDSI